MLMATCQFDATIIAVVVTVVVLKLEYIHLMTDVKQIFSHLFRNEAVSLLQNVAGGNMMFQLKTHLMQLT
uniref:Uncharacterized protein n=1 Tax=Glossina palpalis gambiensis TaxID=67801 RepID=A0A1B0B423_9MUSC